MSARVPAALSEFDMMVLRIVDVPCNETAMYPVLLYAIVLLRMVSVLPASA
jgi:hypothetical protein